MRIVGLRRASSLSWAIGWAIATVHLLVVVAMIAFTARGSRDSQSELWFLPLELLDLPVAVAVFPVGLAAVWVAHGLGLSTDPWLIAVAVGNGVVGSLFYLILPPALSAHRQFKRGLA